jgi:hypothetical protein
MIKDPRGGPKALWPLFVGGRVVGMLEGVVDVAVRDERGLCIWAFTSDGRGVCWRIGQPRVVAELKVAKSGLVVSATEEDVNDGDVEMTDADEVEARFESCATRAASFSKSRADIETAGTALPAREVQSFLARWLWRTMSGWIRCRFTGQLCLMRMGISL